MTWNKSNNPKQLARVWTFLSSNGPCYFSFHHSCVYIFQFPSTFLGWANPRVLTLLGSALFFICMYFRLSLFQGKGQRQPLTRWCCHYKPYFFGFDNNLFLELLIYGSICPRPAIILTIFIQAGSKFQILEQQV